MSQDTERFMALITEAELEGYSAESYAQALKDAHDIGHDDAIAGKVDPAIKNSALAEDLVRSYLRGYEQGEAAKEEAA